MGRALEDFKKGAWHRRRSYPLAEFCLGCLEKPSLQDGQVVFFDILKTDSEAKMGLRVNDDSFGLEILALRIDFKDSLDTLLQRFAQFHETAVEA